MCSAVSLLMEGGSFFVAVTRVQQEPRQEELRLGAVQRQGSDDPGRAPGGHGGGVRAGAGVHCDHHLGAHSRPAGRRSGFNRHWRLLCTVGLLLARYTRSLLLGEGVTPEFANAPLQLIEGTPGVLKVTQFLSMHLGPEAVILALKVRFSAGHRARGAGACNRRHRNARARPSRR